MPLFLSEEEFRLCSHDAFLVAERADAVILDLRRQLETVRAEADAASITAEQTCTLLEQKYAVLSSDLSRLQGENARLSASAEERLAELADARAEKHQLHLKAIGKDGEIERLNMEISELHKSKRQLLQLLEQKDVETSEKNSTIQSYFDKIVSLTDSATSKGATVHEIEVELSRCHATCNRLSQEKELIERHNLWLNEELTSKVNGLNELRKEHMDVEANMSAKLTDLEKQLSNTSDLYNRSKERVHELEEKVKSLEEELCSMKDAAAANEEHFAAELSTVTKLVELYKASSEEWSKKSVALEGVIKALEKHLDQVENDLKEKLERETSMRKDFEVETASLKEKLEKLEIEIENARKASELSLLPLSSFQVDTSVEELSIDEDEANTARQQMLVPRIPSGISGTALAASLLRDGWSLAKMYEKYQETADALRHEKWGRKHSEAILERVLREIEAKAEVILEERVEHTRMMEAYSLMNQKLQQALLEHDNFESTIRELKSELRRRERDCTIAEKEISDIEKQVTVLLKECQDVQIRCGATTQSHTDNSLISSSLDVGSGLDTENVISEQLLTFKDIHELVEQNVKLRSVVRRLSNELENKDSELKEGFQMELQKVTDEAVAKVEAVLKRTEEQGRMIDSLHSSVAMYKRLYEEERKIRTSSHPSLEAVPGEEDGKKDLMMLFEGSQESSKKAHEELSERIKNLEEELTKMRSEHSSLRLERDKLSLEATFARARVDSLNKDIELQRQETNAVSARNVELTHLIVEYQKRVRESSASLNAAEENSRKLSMEVSLLKHEKEILLNSEKRSSEEVRSLTERVYRLQSRLDTAESSKEVRENARATEKKKLEEYLQRVERDWAEAKKELQVERDHVRSLIRDKEQAVDNSIRQVEEMRKELADAWRAVASAESRAAVAEARCSDMETKLNVVGKKVLEKNSGHHDGLLSANEGIEELQKAEEEIEKLREEARCNKDYMQQYKEIAQTNEVALKQIESAHMEYKAEAERLKNALEGDVESLRNKVYEMERFCAVKSEEASTAMAAKEKALSSALAETACLKGELTEKLAQIGSLEILTSSLKDELEKEHKRWRTAQDNYERQVILQSETIQELTSTSKELSLLQEEMSKLREISEALKTENDMLKVSWEKEKSVLVNMKNAAEEKYNEINEQNKILHNRLESLHVKLIEKEQKVSGLASQNLDSQSDSDLQSVISYLRRSREIAETEITLLKQEKLRLRTQLETALKASETAQALLNSERENSRAALLKDEEFKSLKLQIREINLLRESNMQLREENKHNFEGSQKFLEEAQKAKIEAEKLSKLLSEKEIQLDSCQKAMEMQNVEIGHLKNRITELLDSFKNIDVAEHERMKDELQQVKIHLGETEMQLQMAKNHVLEKHDQITRLEEDLTKSQVELAEQENKLTECRAELVEHEKKLIDASQADANLRQENDRHRKLLGMSKKRNDTLAREKEELTKENQSLLKQLEDSKSSTQSLLKQLEDSKSSTRSFLKQLEDSKSSRKVVDNASELAMKEKEEKDTRIQTLEKILERERDESKKERTKRLRTEKTMVDLIENVNKEKKKVEDELARHKHAIVNVLEHAGITSSQLPAGIALDEQTSAYFLQIDNLEAAAKSFLTDGSGAQPLPVEASVVDTSIVIAGAVTTQQTRPSAPPEVSDERDKRPAVVRSSIEVRKSGRRLVRPRLEGTKESSADIDMPGVEGGAADEGKTVPSQEPEPSGAGSMPSQPSLCRKRAATPSSSELREESAVIDDPCPDIAPPLKKPRELEARQESSEGQAIPTGTEDFESRQSVLPTAYTLDGKTPIEDPETDQAPAALNEESNADDEKPEEIDINTTEREEKMNMDGTNQEDETLLEGDTTMEEVDKPREGIELIDDSSKVQGNDVLQPAAGEDGREEGELILDESEQQQQEDSVTTECDQEPVSTDVASVADEAGEIVEAASSEPLNEKTEGTDVVEEVGEGLEKPMGNTNEVNASDVERSPQPSARAREGSPSSVPVSEPQSGSSTAEVEEPRSGTTISIRERARQNALLRQARMVSQPPSTGRGRSAGGSRVREGGRGTRGGRHGRGQGFGDRKQS